MLNIPEPLRKKLLPLVRVARVKAIAHGYGAEEINVAERLYGKTDANTVETIRKSAVDTHGTTGTGSELFSATQVASDFADAVRPLTALGKLNTIQVPINVQLPFLATRTSFGFVTQRSPIAASAPAFGNSVNMSRKKIAGIVVVTKDLLDDSLAEDFLMREMATAVVDALDGHVFDVTDADASRPQAVNYPADPVYDGNTGSVQTTDNLLRNMLGDLIVAGSNLRNAVFVTTPANLGGLALFRHSTTGELAYPGLSVTEGGNIAGVPIIPSAAHPASGLTLVDGSEILIADNSEIQIRISESAMIDQDDGPDGSTRIPLFHTDSIGIRVTLWINWQLRRDFVSYCQNFALSPGASSTA